MQIPALPCHFFSFVTILFQHLFSLEIPYQSELSLVFPGNYIFLNIGLLNITTHSPALLCFLYGKVNGVMNVIEGER